MALEIGHRYIMARRSRDLLSWDRTWMDGYIEHMTINVLGHHPPTTSVNNNNK